MGAAPPAPASRRVPDICTADTSAAPIGTQAPSVAPAPQSAEKRGPQSPHLPVTQHPQRGAFGPLSLLMPGSQTRRISPPVPTPAPKTWPRVLCSPHLMAHREHNPASSALPARVPGVFARKPTRLPRPPAPLTDVHGT